MCGGGGGGGGEGDNVIVGFSNHLRYSTRSIGETTDRRRTGGQNRLLNPTSHMHVWATTLSTCVLYIILSMSYYQKWTNKVDVGNLVGNPCVNRIVLL